jgi:hypothetical protein
METDFNFILVLTALAIGVLLGALLKKGKHKRLLDSAKKKKQTK